MLQSNLWFSSFSVSHQLPISHSLNYRFISPSIHALFYSRQFNYSYYSSCIENSSTSPLYILLYISSPNLTGQQTLLIVVQKLLILSFLVVLIGSAAYVIAGLSTALYTFSFSCYLFINYWRAYSLLVSSVLSLLWFGYCRLYYRATWISLLLWIPL